MQLFEPTECGNGYVEAGEECDCGVRTVSYCSNVYLFLLSYCTMSHCSALHSLPESFHKNAVLMIILCSLLFSVYFHYRNATKNAARNVLCLMERTAVMGPAAITPVWWVLISDTFNAFFLTTDSFFRPFVKKIVFSVCLLLLVWWICGIETLSYSFSFSLPLFPFILPPYVFLRSFIHEASPAALLWMTVIFQRPARETQDRSVTAWLDIGMHH